MAGVGGFVDGGDIVAPHPVVGEPALRSQVEPKQTVRSSYVFACQRDALPWLIEIDGGGDDRTSVSHAPTGGKPVGGSGGDR